MYNPLKILKDEINQDSEMKGRWAVMTDKKVYLYPQVIGQTVGGATSPIDFTTVDLSSNKKTGHFNLDLLRQYEALGAYEIDVYQIVKFEGSTVQINELSATTKTN
jgi:hypothetical protein